MKNVIKRIYRFLPLKRQFFEAMRHAGMTNVLPQRSKRFLVFPGAYTVQTAAGPFKLLNGYGREIEAAVFWGGLEAFEYSTLKWWFKLTQISNYIVDVGANTGIYSLIAKTYQPNAHVHAFEPLERVYSILEENFGLNVKADGSLKAHRVALSDYTGTGEMFDLPVEHMYTASLNHDVHADRGQVSPSIKESVSVMRLDDFLQQHRIEKLDLIKIDVESHEAAVVRGMGDIIQQQHPSMIVEIWNNDVGVAVEAELSGCSYLYFALTDAHPTQTPHICNDFPEKGYINYLICTRDIALQLGIIQ